MWYCFDVYLYTNYCIVIHMMWISLILKNGIKVVMWYSFVGYFGLQVGNMCWFWFDFVCLVGNFVFYLKSYPHIISSYPHCVDNFFSIKIFHSKNRTRPGILQQSIDFTAHKRAVAARQNVCSKRSYCP